jgi:hypothetical protein
MERFNDSYGATTAMVFYLRVATFLGAPPRRQRERQSLASMRGPYRAGR